MAAVVEVRIDVARSPEEVFAFVADHYFENVRRWDRDLIEVTPLGDGVMGLGTRAVEVDRGLTHHHRARRGEHDPLARVEREDAIFQVP